MWRSIRLKRWRTYRSVIIPCNVANIYMHDQWIVDVSDFHCLLALWLLNHGLAGFHDILPLYFTSSKTKVFFWINFASFTVQALHQVDKQGHLLVYVHCCSLTPICISKSAELITLTGNKHIQSLAFLHTFKARGNLTSTISKSNEDSSQVQCCMPRCHGVYQIFVYFNDAQLTLLFAKYLFYETTVSPIKIWFMK